MSNFPIATWAREWLQAQKVPLYNSASLRAHLMPSKRAQVMVSVSEHKPLTKADSYFFFSIPNRRLGFPKPHNSMLVN
jgi:hypothetical protein